MHISALIEVILEGPIPVEDFLLSSWMDRADLTLVYKVLNNLDPGQSQKRVFTPATTAGLSGHSLNHFKESTRLDARKAAFSQRVVNNCNEQTLSWLRQGFFLKKRLDATCSALFPDNT